MMAPPGGKTTRREKYAFDNIKLGVHMGGQVPKKAPPWRPSMDTG